MKTVLRGGRVLDPASGIDGVCDVVMEGGRISEVAASARTTESDVIVDVSGKIVVPGLIDLHAHAYTGVGPTGFDVDKHCLPRGVTTVVDGGSAGSATYPGFRDYVQKTARSRILAFINLSYVGLVGGRPLGELLHDEWIDIDGAVSLAQEHPEFIKGIKVRVDERAVGDRGVLVMARAREAADRAGLPLMVHICGARVSLETLLDYFKQGDIVTHMMTDRGQATLLRDGELLDCAVEARQRGVIFDVAHGRSHFPWDYAARLLETGFLPDTISSDLASWSLDGPVFDLITTMNKFLYLGRPVEEVISAVTKRPAEVLGMQNEIGSLKTGTDADVTVLTLSTDLIELIDTRNEIRQSDVSLAVDEVYRAGVRV